MKEPVGQLIDLPQDQVVRPSICSPKIVFLLILTSFFVGQNIYHSMMNPVQKVKTPPPEIDEAANSALAFERLIGYFIVSVIGVSIYILLKRANMKQEQRKAEQQTKIALAKEEQIRAQLQQKERKMFNKLQEEEKQQLERQKVSQSRHLTRQDSQQHEKKQ